MGLGKQNDRCITRRYFRRSTISQRRNASELSRRRQILFQRREQPTLLHHQRPLTPLAFQQSLKLALGVIHEFRRHGESLHLAGGQLELQIAEDLLTHRHQATRSGILL